MIYYVDICRQVRRRVLEYIQQQKKQLYKTYTTLKIYAIHKWCVYRYRSSSSQRIYKCFFRVWLIFLYTVLWMVYSLCADIQCNVEESCWAGCMGIPRSLVDNILLYFIRAVRSIYTVHNDDTAHRQFVRGCCY